MDINKGTLVAMKRKKVKILYTLIRKTILGTTMKVKTCHEKSSCQNDQNSILN